MSRHLFLLGEGDGEEKALPALIRRLLKEKQAGSLLWTDERHFMRVGNVSGLLKTVNGVPGSRWIDFLKSAAKTQPCSVLLVLDGDRPPPGFASELCWPSRAARRLAEIAAAQAGAGSCLSVAIVFARTEFETWLFAGLNSLATRLPSDSRLRIRSASPFPAGDAESHGKTRLRQHVPGYSETRDQHILTQYVDLDEIRSKNLRSFRRLEHALEQLIDAARNDSHICTPESPEAPRP